MIELPPYIIAATRLGAITDVGHAVVFVRDNKRAMRSFWIAEFKGMQDCKTRYVLGEDPKPNPTIHITAIGYEQRTETHKITTERSYVVTSHLGNEPIEARSTAVVKGDAIGVPVLGWPANNVDYHVHWGDGLWKLHYG